MLLLAIMDKEFISKLFSNYKPAQINIPFSEKEYNSGNGETVWVAISNDDHANKYHKDVSNDTIEVMLLNNSVGFPSLTQGSKISCELQGTKIPIIPWNSVKDLIFDEVTVNQKKAIMQLMGAGHTHCAKCNDDCTGEIYISHAEPFAD